MKYISNARIGAIIVCQNDFEDHRLHPESLRHHRAVGAATLFHPMFYKKAQSCYASPWQRQKVANVWVHFFRLPFFLVLGSFEARLVGGTAPNVGRVEVKYDNIWSNVCYEGEKGDRSWNFYNTQVLCRQLGFPGAMRQQAGGQGNGTRNYITNDYRCQKGKIHCRLSIPVMDSTFCPSEYASVIDPVLW